MPTVLMISTTFPPFGNIGAVRLGCFAKYLQRIGWNVISVTLHHRSERDDETIVANWSDVETEFYHDSTRSTPAGRLIHSCGRKYNIEYLTYGLHPYTVLKDGQRVLRDVFARHEIDVVFASFVRPIAIRLASWSHRQYHVPWVADFRDTIEMIDFKWMQRIVCVAETSVLETASHITTTTATLARHLKYRHSTPVTILPNGFDPEDYTNLTPADFDKFTILYPGNILPGRNPMPVYRVVDQLIHAGMIDAQRVQILHYGAQNFRMDDEWLSSMLTDIHHRGVVHYEDRIPRRDALSAQLGAHINLLLPGLVGKAAGNVPAKLYEYLRADRPILSVAQRTQSEVDTILRGCAEAMVTSRMDEIRGFILRHYQSWLKGKQTSLGLPHQKLGAYSRKEQSLQLAEVLKSVIATAS